jgi:DNA repair protein RadC
LKGLRKGGLIMGKRVVKYGVQLIREHSGNYEIDVLLNSSGKTKEFLQKVFEIENWHNEKLGMICLDAANRVVGVHLVTEGTVNQAVTFTREVVVRALLNNAVNVILFHNHFGGISPSEGDIRMTENVKKAFELVGLNLLDHVIVCEGEIESFADKGLI